MVPWIFTYGVIMLRLSSPKRLRFSLARGFDTVYGGGDARQGISAL